MPWHQSGTSPKRIPDGATYFLGHDCERFRPQAGVRYGPALSLLATLFFMWGFITVINNTLLPHLRSVFELNYTQTTLIDRCGSSPISWRPSLRPS
jgi:hypothetical protein